ncbi:MAG: TonB-dependent receptor [Bacteroidetes bacterium]|nr:TonB-dependent receptor [Bacteroidota bacterium]HET6244246.1 hypothetical protein [Bacteroidia bacterium]
MDFSINYGFKGFNIGANYNMVGTQYTDYLNFENETGEGAVGKLKAFSTVDVNPSYSFAGSKNKFVKGITLFATGKNIMKSTRVQDFIEFHQVLCPMVSDKLMLV